MTVNDDRRTTGERGHPGDPGNPGDPEPVGPLAEEAAKLFTALGDWARDQGGQVGAAFGDSAAGVAGHATHLADEVDEHLAAGSAPGQEAPCQWCPVCRTVHVVRQLSPEVRSHLHTAATSLVQAAAAVLATAPPSRQEPGGRRPDPSEQVERIELDEDPSPQPGGQA